MTVRTDGFLEIVSDLTNYVQNERTAAYNEGVDDMLDAVRQWARVNIPLADPKGTNIPDLLDEIRGLLFPHHAAHGENVSKEG